MLDCVSVEMMRQSDAYTIENFVPSLKLMYRAAWGVYRAVAWHGKTAIVVGSGNNGGDGFALACILQEYGYDCTVFTLSSNLSPDSAYYARQAAEAKVAVRAFTPDCLQGYDIVVDCLLGTGFRGAVREPYRTAIVAINSSGAYVVSVDINSGMNGDTGEAALAVQSDLTVTIGFVKTGLITEQAGCRIRRLVCVDIGIVLLREEAKICTQAELDALCPSCEGKYHLCPPWIDSNMIQVDV